jgi:hypothetical protein
MTIKSAISGIIGKTIIGVVVTRNDCEPENQLFIVFSDGTQYEIWGEFSTGGGLARGGMDEAERYARSFGGEVTHIERLGKLPALVQR